jgi:hypothetical protein
MRKNRALATQYFFDVQMIEIAWQAKFQSGAEY